MLIAHREDTTTSSDTFLDASVDARCLKMKSWLALLGSLDKHRLRETPRDL
jgi:hypothetical protein